MEAHPVGAVPALIVALLDNFLWGGGGLLIYLLMFGWFQRARPPLGSIIDVLMDATVISGAVEILIRIFRYKLANVLSPDEHIMMIIGAIALSGLLGKRLFWNLFIAWKGRPPRKSGIHTEDAWSE